ncbi:MAG: mannose-6-phosphate isomerase, class I [Jatrophihabitans sp.]|nr:MAG: mannose-6-phosphate isomerase, class I [Jatrophihabitans sp.]
MTGPAVVPLSGAVRDYAWGSTTAVQRMLGRPVDGTRIAELWFGAHPDDPSYCPDHGTTLEAMVAADPVGMLGPATVQALGPRLPFLVKILAADAPLSIQVHPTREQAERGWAAEDAAGIALTAPQRNYRDRNHKPELLVALTEFDALCGFRPVALARQLLAALALPELDGLAGLLEGPAPLRMAFTYLLTAEDPGAVVDAVLAAAPRLGGEWAPAAAAVSHIGAHFPGDVGVVLSLLLNAVRLRPGEAIYLPAGNVHAYLRGTGVEIMANSDNVLRCALTAKHVDVAELLRITDFTELAEPRWAPGPRGFVVPVPDFRLRALDLDAGPDAERGDAGPDPELGDAGPHLVLCTAGTAEVARGSTSVTLAPGHAAFVPAGDAPFTVRGTGTGYLAATGLPPGH